MGSIGCFVDVYSLSSFVCVGEVSVDMGLFEFVVDRIYGYFKYYFN